jgi:hypothetical protein
MQSVHVSRHALPESLNYSRKPHHHVQGESETCDTPLLGTQRPCTEGRAMSHVNVLQEKTLRERALTSLLGRALNITVVNNDR